MMIVVEIFKPSINRTFYIWSCETSVIDVKEMMQIQIAKFSGSLKQNQLRTNFGAETFLYIKPGEFF